MQLFVIGAFRFFALGIENEEDEDVFGLLRLYEETANQAKLIVDHLFPSTYTTKWRILSWRCKYAINYLLFIVAQMMCKMALSLMYGATCCMKNAG